MCYVYYKIPFLDDDSAWKSLSSGIQGTNIRKKNLSEGQFS